MDVQNYKHRATKYHSSISIYLYTSEKHIIRLEGEIPLIEFFTLSIVGKTIPIDGFFSSWLAVQHPHCQRILHEKQVSTFTAAVVCIYYFTSGSDSSDSANIKDFFPAASENAAKNCAFTDVPIEDAAWK